MHIFEKLKQKRKGMLDDLLPILVFILIVAAMLFTFVEFNSAVNKKTEVNQVARHYILKMEQTGYATNSIQTALIQELKDLGYKGSESGADLSRLNITSNTTKTHQGYGNDICLEFVVYTQNWWLDPDYNIFAPKFVKSSYVPIKIKYYSTSKA